MSKTASQVKGKASPKYRRRNHGRTQLVKVGLPRTLSPSPMVPVKVFRSPFHSAPLACYRSGSDQFIVPAVVGLIEGQTLNPGMEGYVSTLADLAPGQQVCTVQLRPGEGGALCRSAGSFAIIDYFKQGRVCLSVHSRKIFVSARCRATLGRCGGGDAGFKPLLKAGTHAKKKAAKSMPFPHVSRVSMNHHEHRHGSSDGKRLGGRGCYKRGASPGQKCAHIAPRVTGRGGRKNK